LKKVIEKKLTISANNRDVDRLYQEFYSKDKGIAEFKFTLDNLTATKVICLFYFKGTKRYQEVEATIEGNSFTVQFDTSLITTDESVIGYIYFEKVEQSADVYSFMFSVHVSEIDKAVKTPLIERESGRIVNVNDVVTKQELDELFAKIKEQGGTYDDSDIRAKISNISVDIEALKTKTDKDTVYDDTPVLKRLEILESRQDNDTVYNDTEIKQRLENLENKPSVDTSGLVTKQELDGKGYLTQHQSLDDYVKHSELPDPYNDTELKKRVETLENKKEVDTSKFVTEEALAGKGYLTQHQNLDEYAKKSEIPQPYNDSGVKQRLSLIEQKEPQRLNLNGTTLSLSGGGGSIVLPSAPANTSGQVNEYEIHGTGMPNGKVTAPVGTTYVDTNATNGALKWIKRSGAGNQGWEVLTGDTGWRTLNIKSKLGNSFLKVRRKNDLVTYQFGGLSWGWFGVIRRGGVGYEAQGSDKERNCYILGLSGVPQGFRSEASLIGSIYNDKGTPYGTWYLGGYGDSNMLRFQFTDPVPTDRDIGDIRVSSISYLTSEPWPGVLP
jgi:hypothetical protein